MNLNKQPMQKRLIRSKSQRMIGGVCGGIAEYFNIDPTLVRLGFALATVFLTFIAGGIIAYILAMFIVPEE